MNCQQFQDVHQDLARNEWLDIATLKDAFEHADDCSACDELLQEAEVLSADLRSLATAYAGREAPAHIEKSVLEAFAQRKSSAMRQPNLRWTAVASLTCAAALALFALLLMHHRPAPSPQGSHPASPAVPSARTSNGIQEASVSDPEVSATSQGDALSAFEDEDTTAGAFVPLTRTFDPTSLDGGAVVRVVLSPTALQEFGLSASHVDDKQVLADMVVTSDGTPQAIRLVSK